MNSSQPLEKRVSDLEAQIAALRGPGAGGAVPVRGIRKRASWGIGDIPFYDVAIGPDWSRGQVRGHAKGIFAVGDIATGLVALGGIARGGLAVGGLSIGLFTVGGVSLGVLLAAGGLAIGGLALGGGALGGAAVGGGAVGRYACGGGVAGTYVWGPFRRDPEAARFFTEHGLARMCGIP